MRYMWTTVRFDCRTPVTWTCFSVKSPALGKAIDRGKGTHRKGTTGVSFEARKFPCKNTSNHSRGYGAASTSMGPLKQGQGGGRQGEIKWPENIISGAVWAICHLISYRPILMIRRAKAVGLGEEVSVGPHRLSAVSGSVSRSGNDGAPIQAAQKRPTPSWGRALVPPQPLVLVLCTIWGSRGGGALGRHHRDE